ncbi:HD domain-containing protein [Thermosipho atlanticus]|uniref:Putative hydrolases of HD superfamily n=1 Tax=Thermosipho atlanticus DSM 15807 TaxID=1123380 RepID=A0A1M5QLJ8_9BACT|nr:YfbR-like 5'-deoxynucleotidase [Thermosipho atlanticus]SHH14836.1 putative hydrolases of HD superfamily [Thermosipho atlanticus DSM 15807]
MGFGRLIFMLGNLFTIQRWNNKPAIIKFSEADNAYTTLLISFFLKDRYEKKVEESVQWRLSRVLPKLVLSDISLELKERVERFSPDVWKKVREKAFNDLYKVIDKAFIKQITTDEQSVYDKFADVITSLFEAKVNGKLFDYEIPIEELNAKLEQIEIEEKEELLEISKIIFSIVLNMISMTRWNRVHRNIKTTVAGHSFIVVVVAYIISTLLSLSEEKKEEVIKRALLHDLPEAFTGDVITPTKKKSPELDNLVSLVEKEMFLDWISVNPSISYISDYLEFVINPFEGYLGKIVRAADHFAALLECSLEMFSGNKEDVFRDAFFDFKKKLKNFSELDLSEWIDEIEDLIF